MSKAKDQRHFVRKLLSMVRVTSDVVMIWKEDGKEPHGFLGYRIVVTHLPKIRLGFGRIKRVCHLY